MKKLLNIIAVVLLSLSARPLSLNAGTTYTIYTYTSDPKIAAEIIANTTTQYVVSYSTKQYFSNSWFSTMISTRTGATCGGGGTEPCQLDQDINNMIAISTYTGVFMYGSGMTYQNKVDEGVLVSWDQLCGDPTNFTLIQATTATWNAATCEDAISNALDNLFELELSTPTPLEFEP